MFSNLNKIVKTITKSSALRLALLLSLLYSLILLTVGGVSYYVIRDRLLADIDNKLEVAAQTLQSLDDPANYQPDEPEIFWALRDSEGQVIAQNIPISRRRFDMRDLFADLKNGAQTYGNHRVFRHDSATYTILTGVPLNDYDDRLEITLGTFTYAFFGGFIATLAIGGYFGLRARRRLQNVTQTLQKFADGDLNARIHAPSNRDDLDETAHEIDHMMAQLQRLIEQSRNLGANIAHDLRTPLARVYAMLETAEALDENQDIVADAKLQIEKTSYNIDALLRIARIEGGHGTDGFEWVDLDAFAQRFYEDFAALAEDEERSIVLKTETPAHVFCDANLVLVAMVNLFQNALRYGAGEITIFVERGAMGIRDEGEGVSQVHYEDIVKPHFRLDDARHSEGAGLGLAMVKAVAERHEAALVFDNSGEGFSVVLKFPPKFTKL